MTLAPGTRLGPYEVVAQIGVGGMGEVYRATDTNLARQVAIKVLPEAVAADADRLARFDREAKTLAALNHPNIAAIYGLERSSGITGLVMELVDGPTLADRIAQGAIPIDEALPIAKQICEALEAAHEQSIIHRDLKPANIKVRPDGTVKVLDFGLAKAMEPAGSMSPNASMSPTITSPAMMTGVGMILGTAAYMSPEQARGKTVDKRSDIWAFGCVLFEMLTSRAPFAGDDVPDTLANVLKKEPDWSALPLDVPPAVRALLKRCVDKDRRTRVADIAAATFVIDEAANLASDAAAVTAARPSLVRRAALPAAALVLASALTAEVAYFRTVPPSAPEMRLQVVTPPPPDTNGNVSFAISPDGQSIVFSAANGQGSQLWLRSLNTETARPIPGTADASLPFWSPDGRSIGFFSEQKLKRLEIASGNVQTIADSPFGLGATWSADGVILFAATGTSSLFRAAATAGQHPVEVIAPKSGQQSYRFPQFLPDGRRFLFFATGPADVQGVYLGSLDTMETKRIVDADTRAEFLPPHWLLFGRDDGLYAQRVDPATFSRAGDPVLVAGRVARSPQWFASLGISTSRSGSLAYRSDADSTRELVWFDRQGRQSGTLGSIPGLTNRTGWVSPDGRTVVIDRIVNGNEDLWLIETARGVLRRLTFDAAADIPGSWSPDGTRIVFYSSRKGGGRYDIYQRSLAGSVDELLLETAENKNASDWSPDGRFILYSNQSSKTARDIWALPLEGDRKPFVIVQTVFEEAVARFSPDGRWISYTSNETGRNEVFVTRFPDGRRNWQISTNGGDFSRFSGDGRELFYLASDNRIMAVPMSLNANALSVEAGNPVALFAVRPGSRFNPTLDPQRFLVNTPTSDAAASPITVVLNWQGQLNKQFVEGSPR